MTPQAMAFTAILLGASSFASARVRLLTALWSGVGGFHGSADVAPDGGDIDDLSAMVVDHPGDRKFGAVEDGGEIRGDDPVPVLKA